jgi:hypothetical protein
MANNFLTGAANALSQGLEQSNMSKLQLSMLSKRIEMEQQAKQSELTFEHGLNTIAPEKLGALAKIAGAKQEDVDNLKNVFGDSGVPSTLAGGLLQSLGAGNRIPALMPFKTGVDQFGNEQYSTFNKKTGQMGPQSSGSLSPSAAHEISTAVTGYGTLHNTLENIRGRVSQFINAPDAAHIPAQMLNLKLNQFVPQGPAGDQIKAYFADLPATSLRIDKALVGSSRFAESIVNNTQHGMPGLDDTVGSAMAKLDNYDALGKASADATYNFHQIPKDKRNYALPSSSNETAEHFTNGFKAGHQAATQDAKSAYIQSLSSQFGQQPKGSK